MKSSDPCLGLGLHKSKLKPLFCCRGFPGEEYTRFAKVGFRLSEFRSHARPACLQALMTALYLGTRATSHIAFLVMDRGGICTLAIATMPESIGSGSAPWHSA